MIITLGGKAWSGKGTVSKILAQQLHYEIISIGSLKRKLAEEMGLSISEFNILGEKPENQKEFDLKYEEYQKNLPLESAIILESRLGFLCQPKAFKVFLDIRDEVASERIRKDQRTTDNFESPEQALEVTKKRNADDRNRFLSLYNVDLRDDENYDLKIDTSDKTPKEVAQLIIDTFKKKELDSSSLVFLRIHLCRVLFIKGFL